jgi:hypothetical protein
MKTVNLELRINDDLLGDNSGSVVAQILVGPANVMSHIPCHSP